MTSPGLQRSTAKAARKHLAWTATALVVCVGVVGVLLEKRRGSPPDPLSSPARHPAASASCSDPVEPGCSQCLSRMNPDGTPVVLEGNDQGYTLGHSLPTLPTALKPCAKCRKEHRLALKALAAQKTCQEVHVDDAGLATYGKVTTTEGYCSRYRTAADYSMDPSFYGGSCERYCWGLFIARQHCPQ